MTTPKEFHSVTPVPIESVGRVEVSTILLWPELITWETCLFWGDTSEVVERLPLPWTVEAAEEMHRKWCAPKAVARAIVEHGRRWA